MIVRMSTPGIARPAHWGQALARWWRSGWSILMLGATLAVLAMTPSTWQAAGRRAVAAEVWRSSAPLVLWFGVLSALISLVIMRIVLVTAQSYGLSQYALEMMVRVLVLELIPLTAALFVALRVSVPAAVELAAQRVRSPSGGQPVGSEDLLRALVLPRALAAAFATLLLATLSGVVCLVLAYLLVHGFSPWGFERYTRLVGQVFSPAVSLIFALKTAAMALAVAVIPLGSALHDDAVDGQVAASLELQGLVRMFLAILVIEGVSLVGNYY